MEGDPDGKVLPIPESALTALGFALSPSAENIIRCSVSFENLIMQSNQKYVRYQLSISVTTIWINKSSLSVTAVGKHISPLEEQKPALSGRCKQR
jgi:uncharacterized lipoprotein YajG